MILSLIAVSLQSTWYVDASAASPGDGTQASPYTSVEYALSRPNTVDGDTVLVEPGVYTSERIDFLGKEVTVRSTGGADVTTLQGPPVGFQPGSVVSFRFGEGPDAVLEGFTIQGTQGQPSSLPGPGLPLCGGGVFCVGGSSPTLRDLIFTGGAATDFGAGMFLDGGSPTIERLTFYQCGEPNSHSAGAGLWARNASLLLEDCIFLGCKTSGKGAGVLATDCFVVARNSAFRSGVSTYDSGAGLCLLGGTHLIENCQISGNRSGDAGGGLFAQSCLVSVRDSEFSFNTTGVDRYPGGGIAFQGAITGTAESMTVRHSEFIGNQGQFGGGVSLVGIGAVRDCLFDSNVVRGDQVGAGGGGLSASGQTTISGCIFTGNSSLGQFSSGGGGLLGGTLVDRCTFVDNQADGGASAIEGASSLQNSIVRGGSTPSLSSGVAVSYSNVQAGASGLGVIDEDPLFHAGALDVHLLPGSPCIDSGSPSASNDADGTRADMGAYPFDPSHCGVGCEGIIGTSSCVGRPNSTGVGAFLEGVGSSVAADQRVVLNVTDIPRNQFGLFVIGGAPGNFPLGGGSQGLLCIDPPLVRFNEVLSDRGTGIVSFAPDLDDIPSIGAVQAGETWYFQYWYRDLNPFLTSNLSSALRITFH